MILLNLVEEKEELEEFNEGAASGIGNLKKT